MKITQIEAKEIRIGDRVFAEDGSVITVTEIGKGMPRNTIEISWHGGWSALNPKQIVERVDKGILSPECVCVGPDGNQLSDCGECPR